MLDVYLFRDIVGHLVQDNGGQMVFDYAESWLSKPGAIPLSQSLPLRPTRFRNKECRGFFAGILPEGMKRETAARNLGISARNDYAMLERIGGECAGAVTFTSNGIPIPEDHGTYQSLTDQELADILRELPKRPLLAGMEGIRLSLAGAQDKIPVRAEGNSVCLPNDNAPSTHILKPATSPYEGLIRNEALCMKLAAAMGLPVAPVEIRTADGVEYLLVKRYDRYSRPDAENKPVLERLHQEDFCQAQGIDPYHKYQRDGGPSLKQCFALLRRVATVPAIDLLRLLDAVIYNWIVGNSDAHGKNFSLLYKGIGSDNFEIRLAPFYDIVCTLYYPELNREMAMKIGDEYSPERTGPKDFLKFAGDAGLSQTLVTKRVAEVAEILLKKLPEMDIEHPVEREVAELIRSRAQAGLRFRA